MFLLDVIFEALTMLVFSPALLAATRPCARMRYFLSVQVVLEGKFETAHITRLRLFAGVIYVMAFEIGRPHEQLSA